MKRLSTILLVGTMGVFAAAQAAHADPAWYEFHFTGVDIWKMSADNESLPNGTTQDAPRRHREYEQNWDVSATDTTWSLGGGFNTWAQSAEGLAFSLVEFNLWGAGGSTVQDVWGEKYTSVGTAHPDHGFSSCGL